MSKYNHPNKKAQLEPVSELEPAVVLTQISNLKEDKVIKRVDFIADAMINFTLVKHILSKSFDISMTDLMIFFQDKNTKAQYAVPLNNIRTISF